MKVSAIIPVYNEKETIHQIVKRVKKLPFKKEVIIIDDGSTDKTAEKLRRLKTNGVILLSHQKNKGKGATIRTRLKKAIGEIVATQDADLEYSPEELPMLIKPILERKADVVYDSRFINAKHPLNILYWGNRLLTYIACLLFLARVTDMETGYKVFRAKIIKNLSLKADRFDFEPEITAKTSRKGSNSWSFPFPTRVGPGKKLTWKVGITALFTLLKYRFFE